MADITCTNYDDLSDPEEEDVDETREDIRKNLLEDFAAPAAKLTRQSVAHSREHMQVHLRIRPFTNQEKEQGESQDCMEVMPPSSLLMRAPKDSFTFKSSQRGFSNMTHKFTFSRIFDEDTSQKEFFDETMLGTVKDFIDGQNCLVFTYGVTNAGKTYTIQGLPQDGGILPRSLDVIFNSLEGRLFPSVLLKPRFFCDVTKLDDRQRKKEEYIKESVLALADGNSIKQDGTQDSSSVDDADDSKASNYTTATEDSHLEISMNSILDDGSMPSVIDDISSRIPDDTSVDVEAQGPLKFSVWVSFAEIYNEYIYDLLEAIPKSKKIRRQPLKLSEDKTGQIYIKGLKEISIQSADEAYKVLKIGQQNLSMAATKLNHCSSRSHCIFSIKILRVVDVENPHVARVSQLSFCDLAGSERYTRTQNTGDRLKEAGNINTSLLTLGKCIHTLRYNQNHPKSQPKIIPFRESKLTRLFQSFFMGKGKASMVVNVNQCASGFDETIQVLKFSAIAKQVTTVTSKLDNKWKVPAAAGPKLASSRALSLALRQSLSRNRASVAWATPGPQPDTNLDLTTVDESYIEDEDDEDEDEEDEDGQKTPRQSMLNGESRAELVALVETLKMQLIEEKKRLMMMEVQIREEVCQEMAQQLVKIEGDYKDQLEKERVTTEEMYEKRLEMYEKSVKDMRKRPRPDNDTDDEYVSSLLLHAEQMKVQNQEKVIESLHRDVRMLKEALEEAQDKMNSQDHMLTELQGLMEAGSQALEEAKTKLCAKDEKLLKMEESFQKAQDAATSKEQELSGQVHSLAEKVTATEEALREAENSGLLYQEKMAEIQQKHTNQVSQLHSEFKVLQDNLQSFQAMSKTDKDLPERLAAAVSEATELRNQLQSSAEEHSDVVSAFESKIEELQNKLNETEVVIQDLEANLKEATFQVKCTAEKLEMTEASKTDLVDCLQSKIDTLQQEEKEQESRAVNLEKRLAESKTERASLSEKLISLEKSHSDVVAGLEAQIADLKQELLLSAEEDEQQLSQAQKENGEMQEKLTTLKDNHKKEVLRQRDVHQKEIATLTTKLRSLEEMMSKSGSELEKHLSEAKQEAEENKSMFEDLQAKYDTEVGSLQVELKASTKTLARVDIRIEKEKQKCFDAEKKALSLEENLKSLQDKNKDMEDVLADMQARFDQINTQGQEATVRVASLENKLEYLREEMSVEQRAHSETKKLASEYGCQVSLLRSQLETAERTAATSSNMAKQIRELEASLKEMQQALTDKEIALSEASKRQGSATDLRSQLKVLDDKLKESERKRSAADEMVQKLSSQCTELQQSLAQKERELPDLCSQLKVLDDKLKEAESKRSAADEMVQKLSSQCTELQQNLAQKERELADRISNEEKEKAKVCDTPTEIQQLQTKLMEGMPDSQAVTNDDSDTEEMTGIKTRRGSKRGHGNTCSTGEKLQMEVEQLREQLEKERSDQKKVAAESARSLAAKSRAIEELEDANRHLQQQLGLIEDPVDTHRVPSSHSDSSSVRLSALSPSPQPLAESPDLFIVDIKDQESFHQPGRRRTRVEMDLTPLQKKQPARKTRANTRKAKKRKSTELLEEIDIEAFQKRSRTEESSSARPTRSTRQRNTRATKGETDVDQDENVLDSKVADMPSASGRGKRAALSKIGDLLQNTPLAKSAKKFVESAAAHMTSPSQSPDVQVVGYVPQPTTEKKRKRRLLKTDISVPFESSPFEVVSVGESKGDSSHSIVTRKLRSRNTRV